MAGFTEEYDQGQNTGTGNPPKGSAEWAEQNSGADAPTLQPTPSPTLGTQKPLEQQQGAIGDTGSTVATGQAAPESPSTSTDTEHETPVVSPQQRAEAVMGYDEQIGILKREAERRRPETDEEKKKRERREKSKRIIAAVSDGISALSNLYFTSQYAPNAKNANMIKTVDDRIEKLKADREKQHNEYLNYSLKIGDLEKGRAATLRELEAQQERMKLARERARREAEKHKWESDLQPDKKREQKEKANEAEQRAITARAVADIAPQMQQAKLDTEKEKKKTEQARQGSYKASSVNNYASAASHNRSNVPEFSAWDEHGREHRFKTKGAADYYAKQHGTWREDNTKETTKTSRKSGRRTTSSTSTKYKSGGYATKPQAKPQPRQQVKKKTGVSWK